ncbi:MAG TPA: septation protein A [Paracoccaceae bacterium]|nr:septation protein A [Paracoccaceae bacterium]
MAARPIHPALKIALELGPVAGFFLAYRFAGERASDVDRIVVATALFVPLVLASVAVSWRLTRSLPRMAALTAIVVVIFGGLTIWLHDDTFVKMKPTIIYGLFAAILGAGLLRGQSYLQYLMGEVMPMRAEGWMTFTRRFALFFLCLALLNEAVWRTQSTDMWVNFKTFFLPLSTFGFIVTQMPLLTRHMEKGE